MKALYVQMMDLYLIFQILEGRCHGNQIILRKCYQRRLIPLAFVALVLENELQYHDLAVRVNSGDDGATSSKNLVNFCLVTPEMTRQCRPLANSSEPKPCYHLANVQRMHVVPVCHHYSQI